MTAIRYLGVFVVFGFCPALEAQLVDARENLILPVNPPRSFGKSAEPVFEEQLPFLLSILQVTKEIEQAEASGLAPDHPKVKSLQAKLAVMKQHLNSTHSRPRDALPQSLIDRLAQFEASLKEKEAALTREVETLKAEVARLQEELKKAHK
jgi:hypothetical protein